MRALWERGSALRYLNPPPGHLLRKLTVVGFERGLDLLTPHHIHAKLVESISQYKAAHSPDFRYRIKPWGNADTGDWDVWHSTNEPYGDQ